MDTLRDVFFWIAIAMLVDAAIGMGWSDAWQRRLPRINVLRMAIIEAVAALVILIICLAV